MYSYNLVLSVEIEVLKMMEQRKGDKSKSPPKTDKPKAPVSLINSSPSLVVLMC